MTTIQMLRATPAETGFAKEQLAAAIDACFECAAACTACADACLAEDDVNELRRCITLNLNCADLCVATGRVLSRQTDYDAGFTRTVLDACRLACMRCRDECAAHAGMHDHCRVCAESCARCMAACEALLG